MSEKPKPTSLPTEKAIEKLFPPEVVEELRKQAGKEPKQPDDDHAK